MSQFIEPYGTKLVNSFWPFSKAKLQAFAKKRGALVAGHCHWGHVPIQKIFFSYIIQWEAGLTWPTRKERVASIHSPSKTISGYMPTILRGGKASPHPWPSDSEGLYGGEIESPFKIRGPKISGPLPMWISTGYIVHTLVTQKTLKKVN